MIEIGIPHPDFKGVSERLRHFLVTREMVRVLDEVTPEVLAAIREKAPVGKGAGGGKLRDSIRADFRRTSSTSVERRFVTRVHYAPYVIHGTQAHTIEATAARALHWTDASGEGHFARLVHHPGTRANPFAKKAVEPFMPILRARLEEALANTFSEL